MAINWESLFDQVEDALPPKLRTAKYERDQRWTCEDGWIVGYTTTRVIDSTHDGKFLTFAYQPVGKGARSGRATSWKLVYERSFSKRKAARARTVALYLKHSPEFAAKHPNAR